MAKKSGVSAKTGVRAAGRGPAGGRPGGGARVRGPMDSRTVAEELDVEYVSSPGERGRQGRGDEGMAVGEAARDAAGWTKTAARRMGAETRDAAASAAAWTQDSLAEVMRYVKEHPWPTLLIGAGATWLAIDSIRGRDENGERRRSETRPEGRSMMRRTASGVADASRGAGQELERFVRQRPLLAGAAAMGVGMAVGMALPGTLGENRMLGEVRDAVVERAKQAAGGTARAAREVARSAGRLTGGGRE